MSYCVPLGIPHSTFLSWHEHDRAKAIGYILREHERCSRCGTFPEEWLEEDEHGRMVLKEPMPYEVSTINCIGCELLEDQEKEVPRDAKRSIRFFLRRKKRD